MHHNCITIMDWPGKIEISRKTLPVPIISRKHVMFGISVSVWIALGNALYQLQSKALSLIANFFSIFVDGTKIWNIKLYSWEVLQALSIWKRAEENKI